MHKQKIITLLKSGESVNIEFKECKRDINKDVYETVCAFLNRSGGELLLGVDNRGKITGIDKDRSEQIKADFVTAINNPQKTAKYANAYFGIEPIIQEKDIFRFEARFNTEMLEILNDSSSIATPIDKKYELVNTTAQAEVKIRQFCLKARSRDEIQSFLGLKHREHLRKDILNPLVKSGKLKLTIPDKPKSPNQKYIIADKDLG